MTRLLGEHYMPADINRKIYHDLTLMICIARSVSSPSNGPCWEQGSKEEETVLQTLEHKEQVCITRSLDGNLRLPPCHWHVWL